MSLERTRREALPALIANYQTDYNRLFDNSAHLTEEQLAAPLNTLALTALTRRTMPKLHISDRQNLREGIHDWVFDTLQRHQQQAESDEPALYGIRDQKDLEPVGDLTTQVILSWQTVCRRTGVPSPFEETIGEELTSSTSFTTPERLVIQTAAGVLAILQTDASRPKDMGWASALVYRYGPEYGRRWLNGSRAAEIFEDDLEATHSFLPHVYPSMLRRLVSKTGNNDLEDDLRQRKSIALNDLADKELAATLEWTPEKVQAVFTPDVKAQIAFFSPERAIARATDLRDRIEDLNDTNIMRKLGHSLAVLQEYVPFWLKHRVAIRYSDPLGTLDKILNLAAELNGDYDLPPMICSRLAAWYPTNARRKAASLQHKTSVWAAMGQLTKMETPEDRVDLTTLAPQPFHPFPGEGDKVMWLVPAPEGCKVAYVEACGATLEVRDIPALPTRCHDWVVLNNKQKFGLLLLTLGAGLEDIDAYGLPKNELTGLLTRLGLGSGAAHAYNQAAHLVCRTLLEPVTSPHWVEKQKPDFGQLAGYLAKQDKSGNRQYFREQISLLAPAYTQQEGIAWQGFNLLMLLTHADERLPGVNYGQ